MSIKHVELGDSFNFIICPYIVGVRGTSTRGWAIQYGISFSPPKSLKHKVGITLPLSRFFTEAGNSYLPIEVRIHDQACIQPGLARSL